MRVLVLLMLCFFLRFLSVSQDRSRDASQDRSEGELSQNQPQGAVSVPSLTAIDREPEKQPQPTPEELSREEIERKAATILDEYFGIEDLKVLSHRHNL